MSNIESALSVLAEAKAHVLQRTGKSVAGLSFSGGKESLCVAELASRTFDEVVAFNMYLVPGLVFIEERLEAARKRWGFQIIRYPHWLLSHMLREGLYRPPPSQDLLASVPILTIRDVYDWFVGDTGIPLILTGIKAADSLYRRRTLVAVQYMEVFHPIAKWLHVDVETFLAANGIPMPPTSTGEDLTALSLEYIFLHHPEDFRRLCEFFPFAEAVVWRRRFYSLPTAA